MKISDLIKELQYHLEEFGDLTVYIENCEPVQNVFYAAIEEDIWGNPLQVGLVIES